MEILKKIDGVVIAVLKVITIALLVVLTLILTANIFVRYVPVMSLHWLDEIVELTFAALVFYGAAAVWILKGHFSAGNWIERKLKNPRARAAFRLLVDFIAFVFIAVFFWYSKDLVSRSLELTSVFQFPKRIIYLCMPISSAIMLLYSVKFIVLGVVQIIRPGKAAV